VINSITPDGLFHVTFVDYGNSDVVPLPYLRPMEIFHVGDVCEGFLSFFLSEREELQFTVLLNRTMEC